jgi:replication factor C subunit 2/4
MQIVPGDVLQRLVQACKSGEFDLAHTEVTEIIAEGHPVSQIFSQLFDYVIQSTEMSDEQKARVCERLAEADKVNTLNLFSSLFLRVVACNALEI